MDTFTYVIRTIDLSEVSDEFVFVTYWDTKGLKLKVQLMDI